MLSYSIVIPTNKPYELLIPLFSCIKQQTHLPRQLVVICDRRMSINEAQDMMYRVQKSFASFPHIKLSVITNITHPSFVPNLGVSFVRNYGIQCVQTPLVCMVDDDNQFDPHFFGRFLEIYIYACKGRFGEYVGGIVLVPTEIYHRTGRIRSQGYIGFNHWIGRPKAVSFGKKIDVQSTVPGGILQLRKKHFLFPIAFSSSNCIFGPTKLFQEFPFDIRLQFVYEDFLFTRILVKILHQKPEKFVCGQQKIKPGLYCVQNIPIYHHMKQKTKVEDLYVHTSFCAYQKARNRIFFVRQTSTFVDKFVYFCCGLWVHTFYLIIQVLFHVQGWKQKKNVFFALLRGTVDGLFWKKCL